MSYGFVYVLGHHCMPGVYKVGFTERSPRALLEELSKSTSVPGDFDLICYAEYENPRQREQEIHSLLEKFRVTPDREFFKCDLMHITNLVMDEEEAVSLCEHQKDAFLYSDSPLFRERLRAAEQMARDVGIEPAQNRAAAGA
jgi:hypothetical protein